MKNKNLFFKIISLTIVTFLFTSCYFTRNVTEEVNVMKDFQVPYDAEIPLEIEAVGVFQFTSDEVNNFVYENEDLKVYYNFHGNESTVGALIFKIQNKTNQNIFIDLAYSSFINNGRATNYTNAVDITGKVLLIPDNSYLELNNFKGITNANKEDIDTLIKETYYSYKIFQLFNKNNSPLVIRNKITYGFQENITTPKVIDNTFWVNQLNVYSQPDFDFLSKEEIKNKLIYHGSFMGKGITTKYRTETKGVKENVTVRKRVYSPGATTAVFIVGFVGFMVLFIQAGTYW